MGFRNTVRASVAALGLLGTACQEPPEPVESARYACSLEEGQAGPHELERRGWELVERAYQRMMDLRPDASAYSRVAHFRPLVGDVEGAPRLSMAATTITTESVSQRAALETTTGLAAALGAAKPRGAHRADGSGRPTSSAETGNKHLLYSSSGRSLPTAR